jgi:hypothetical protein
MKASGGLRRTTAKSERTAKDAMSAKQSASELSSILLALASFALLAVKKIDFAGLVAGSARPTAARLERQKSPVPPTALDKRFAGAHLRG